ncbi:polysaccharide deacetylase family protein [candidate division WOR-3 bacterium]|nr:polysaccharide deacetylase family protein [candidate division WOR-3 bacterium]
MQRVFVAVLIIAGLVVGQPSPGQVGSTLGVVPPDLLAADSAPSGIPDLSHRTVVFSVDDGYHSVFTKVYPLLRQHGMTMTLGVICDYLRGGEPSYAPSAGFMKRSEIQQMVDSLGIEIASHSISHPFLTRVDSAAAWKEIKESKTLLESLFGGEVLTFVYPYGDVNARIRAMTRAAGYRMGRAVRPGRPNLAADPFRLPTVELRSDTRLEDIQETIAARPLTIILMHQVVDRPTVFTQWNSADFQALVEWLAGTGVRVATLAELYREWWYERMGVFMEQVAAAYPHERKRLLFQDVDVDATQALQP